MRRGKKQGGERAKGEGSGDAGIERFAEKKMKYSSVYKREREKERE